jgi:GGDEF domain-containing protein
VIRLTGQIIDETVSQFGGADYFVGHIGGDDFVMLVEQGHVEALCQAIIGRFSRMIVQHYSPEDLAAECIQGIDRYGTHRTFPIMTISIAVLMCSHGDHSRQQLPCQPPW